MILTLGITSFGRAGRTRSVAGLTQPSIVTGLRPKLLPVPCLRPSRRPDRTRDPHGVDPDQTICLFHPILHHMRGRCCPFPIFRRDATHKSLLAPPISLRIHPEHRSPETQIRTDRSQEARAGARSPPYRPGKQVRTRTAHAIRIISFLTLRLPPSLEQTVPPSTSAICRLHICPASASSSVP